MNYKEIIESRYNRQNWQLLLRDIFGSKIKFWSTPSIVATSSAFAKQALWLGTITLSDEQTIAVYEVELADSVDIERNRRGIRDMLLTTWRNNGNAGAFMFCYRKSESVLRFSYVSEAWKFAEDGSYQKETTDARRYTYLLGEGHRSRTAIQQFEKLRDSGLSLKDLTKAFSVDAVSDMFFDGYKKQYEDIIFYITGKRMVKVANKWEERLEGKPCQHIMQQFSRFPNPEKAIRDYVKKLMGRLVFLQFLQKKGWLGVGIHDEWGSGDSEFIQNLFARCNDKDHFIDKVLEPLFNDLNSENEKKLPQYRTPYLNGGLFEQEAADGTDFPLPEKYMKSLLDFFASYNFTIDENDPDDAEVGVDPEMLGRIFENLLEDNKDKGAFYTPKEIVSYMCRESLIAYLQTNIEDETTKEAIRQFVTTHQVQEHLPENTDQLLKDVKICDPAIGSGAFPMGLLKELFLCRTALEGISQHQAAEIKKHIIQQNVYGVDIERGAVDIARLRFWLSLIVDEETPQALPNLDFKIMQGNSLLEQYKGVDLSAMTERKLDSTGMYSFFEDMIDVYRRELREMLAEYYNCTDHNAKQTLRTRIIDNVKLQLQEQHINVDFGDLDLSGNDQFFLWHTWFHDVFSKGGFDIVIGNPPYVAIRSGAISEDDKRVFKSTYKAAKGQFDLYALFIEQGIGLLKDMGILTMITESTFVNNKDFVPLREFIVEDNKLAVIAYLGEEVFTSASVDVTISSIIKKKYETEHRIEICQSYDDFLEHRFIKIHQSLFDSKESNYEIKVRSDLFDLSLFEKLKSRGRDLGSIAEMPRGAEFGANFDKISNVRLNKGYYPLLVGKDIKRYSINFVDRYVPFDKSNISVYKESWIYEQPKLLIQRIRNLTLKDRIVATYDDEGYICTNTLRMLYIKEETQRKIYSLKFILGLLNSTLINHIFRTLFLNKDIYKYQLQRIPIPTVTYSQQQPIIELVDRILNTKRTNILTDTTALESEIDRLVYQLYGLTDEEIAVIVGA